MNPYCVDYQALNRGSGEYSDSAMVAVVFKQRLASLMNFSQNKQILGKVSAFIWRIEYQKRGLPHSHIVFWTNCDTNEIHAGERIVNVRFPKTSLFLDNNRMASDFRELIETYQLHQHSPSGKS
jgi:hypothetical protein